MAKGGRKKREKRKDFQKVKLKVGKKKPKADNFTDTTFKSRSIQIREQLKSANTNKDEPVTQRKQNIQELMCQLNHYNSSMRSSAINGVKSLLSSHPTLLNKHLSTLISSLSVIMTDKDMAVRQAGTALLRVMMDTVPSNQMSPFFSVVCMHLCCAMTHIQEDIQLDSLVVMDMILEHYPGLISPHSQELLTNFVHLISQQRSKIGGSGSLKVNPSSKMAGQKWRLKVLQMLKKLLVVIKHAKDVHKHSQRSGTAVTVGIPSDYHKAKHASFLKANGAFNGEQPAFVIRSGKSTSSGSADFLSDPAAIADITRTFVPLLLQCWGEVTPVARSTQSAGVSLGRMAAEALQCILGILQTVWDLLAAVCQETGDTSALQQMQKAYLRKFEQNFLPGFPYTVHQPPMQKKRKIATSSSGSNPLDSAHLLNLATCNLLLSVAGENRDRFWVETVTEFVEDLLSDDRGLPKEQQHVLLEVVRKIVTDASEETDHLTSVVDALYTYYINAHPLSQKKLIALKSYAELCLERTRPDVTNQPPMFPEYLHSLGQLVVDARTGTLGTSQEALDTLLLAARRGYSEAIKCIENHLCDWLDGENGLILSLGSDLQRTLLECLYHVHQVSSQVLQSLAKSCCNPSIDAKYAVLLLANRFLEKVYLTSRLSSATQSEFINFLLTVAMGLSLEEIMDAKDNMKTECAKCAPLGGNLLVDSGLPVLCVCEDTPNPAALSRCIDINEAVCRVYRCFPKQDAVVKAVQSRIDVMWTTCSYLPTQATYSILNHANTMYAGQRTPSPFPCSEDMLARLCLVTLCQTVTNNKLDREREERTWATTLWQLVVDVLVTGGSTMVGNLLQLMHGAISAVKGEETLELIGTVITRLIQTRQLRSRVQELGRQLQALVDVIKDHHLLSRDARWLVELKYEASLLPQVLDSSG